VGTPSAEALNTQGVGKLAIFDGNRRFTIHDLPNGTTFEDIE